MRNIIPFLMILLSTGCIGTDVIDDFVQPEITILNEVTSIEVGTTYQFNAVFRNNTGMEQMIPLEWSSEEPGVIMIDNEGNATALMKGETVITVNGMEASYSFLVAAGDSTAATLEERTASLHTVSSYPLSGSAVLKTTEDGLILEIGEDFVTTSALPGLYVYLSNNTNSTANAVEISRVTKFTGAQSYSVPGDVDLFEFKYVLFFCKPFVVPIGNGELMP